MSRVRMHSLSWVNGPSRATMQHCSIRCCIAEGEKDGVRQGNTSCLFRSFPHLLIRGEKTGPSRLPLTRASFTLRISFSISYQYGGALVERVFLERSEEDSNEVQEGMSTGLLYLHFATARCILVGSFNDLPGNPCRGKFAKSRAIARCVSRGIIF